MNKLLILVALFVICSCQPEKGISDLNYPIESIQSAMVDLYIASEAIKELSDKEKDSLASLYKSQIYAIHNVEFEKLEKDIHLIKSNDELYHKVHKAINDSINVIEIRFQSLKSPEIEPISSSKSKTNSITDRLKDKLDKTLDDKLNDSLSSKTVVNQGAKSK